MQILERHAKETGREYALRVLKKNIISLDLTPGSVWSENELAQKLGLSRTPVREALIELSKSQVVEILPQKGSRIAMIDMELVEEARFLRQVLETAIVELACDVADEQAIQDLTENLELQQFYLKSGSSQKLMQLDNEFHKKLFAVCRKDLIRGLIESMTTHYDRIRTLSLEGIKDIKIVEDHQDILKAIRNRNKAEAVTAMNKHLMRYKLDEEFLRSKYPDYFKE